MKLIEVEYPFEVDEEKGLSSLLYPSIKAAKEGAISLYEQVATEEDEEGVTPVAESVVYEVTVRKLTKQAVCDILDSGGEGWREARVRLGVLRPTKRGGVIFLRD